MGCCSNTLGLELVDALNERGQDALEAADCVIRLLGRKEAGRVPARGLDTYVLAGSRSPVLTFPVPRDCRHDATLLFGELVPFISSPHKNGTLLACNHKGALRDKYQQKKSLGLLQSCSKNKAIQERSFTANRALHVLSQNAILTKTFPHSALLRHTTPYYAKLPVIWSEFVLAVVALMGAREGSKAPATLTLVHGPLIGLSSPSGVR
mmetsp:Transcript_1312/g.4717  ORF Transcript_1312/g.4717 Transcript_1312/m.4717 type:complete len:208 (-) Transcript_1312:1230-1853(-)